MEASNAKPKTNPNQLSTWCDADFSGKSEDSENGKSTSGYAIFLNGGLIAYASKLQPRPATSTAEAEYMALFLASKETYTIRMILREINVACSEPTTVYIDSQPCLKIAQYKSRRSKSGHIHSENHAVRDYIEQGEICIQWVPGVKNIADIFTKTLTKIKFQELSNRICNPLDENLENLTNPTKQKMNN